MERIRQAKPTIPSPTVKAQSRRQKEIQVCYSCYFFWAPLISIGEHWRRTPYVDSTTRLIAPDRRLQVAASFSNCARPAAVSE